MKPTPLKLVAPVIDGAIAPKPAGPTPSPAELMTQVNGLISEMKRTKAAVNRLGLQVKGLKADILELKITSHRVCGLLEDLHDALKVNIERP